MKDILTILSIIFMVFCVTCGIHEKKLKEANNAGYQAGYTESYNSISNEYEPKFTAQKKEFQTKLNTLEKEYQKKISKAKEDGLAFTSAKIPSANFFASSFVRFTPLPAALPV